MATKASRPKSRSIEIATLAIGLIAAALPVFLTLRTESQKALTVRFVSSRSLVSIDRQRARGLQVAYNGQVIATPFLLSGWVENTGNVPILARDIEQYPTLHFSSSKILGAFVSERHPPGIDVIPRLHGSLLIIEHRLLNPGDSFGFDVLSDGQLQLPDVSFRIAGVSRPIILRPSTDRKSISVTWVSMPLPWQYLLLTLMSMLVITAIVVGVFALSEALGPLLRARSPRGTDAPSSNSEAFADVIVQAATEPVRLSPASALILESAGKSPQEALGIQPDSLPKILQEKSADLLAALKLSPQLAADNILREVRAGRIASMASRAFTSLPSGIDGEVADQIRRLNPDDLDLSEVKVWIRTIIDNAKEHARVGETAERLDWSEFWFGSLLLICGVAGVLIIGGSWQALLGM